MIAPTANSQNHVGDRFSGGETSGSLPRMAKRIAVRPKQSAMAVTALGATCLSEMLRLVRSDRGAWSGTRVAHCNTPPTAALSPSIRKHRFAGHGMRCPASPWEPCPPGR